MVANRRIGILGGTFDPIHVGHLAVAHHAIDALDLDTVILIPNGIPAWKLDRAIAPASDRWAMAWLATRDDPHVTVSRMEVDRRGVTITVDTVRAIREEMGTDCDLFLIAGSDSVEGMPLWEGIGEIARSIRIAAIARPGHDMGMVLGAIGKCPEPLDVTVINMPAIDLSSTAVRAMVREGRDVTPLVGGDVARYIRDAGLYLGEGIPCGETEDARKDVVVGRDCVGVGIGAVIMRDDEVLLLRRMRIPNAGMWDLPGGKVELGETIREATIREVMEETGLEVTGMSLLCVSDLIAPADELHFVVIGLAVEATGEARNMEPTKHSELGWFPLEDVPQDLTETARRALALI